MKASSRTIATCYVLAVLGLALALRPERVLACMGFGVLLGELVTLGLWAYFDLRGKL